MAIAALFRKYRKKILMISICFTYVVILLVRFHGNQLDPNDAKLSKIEEDYDNEEFDFDDAKNQIRGNFQDPSKIKLSLKSDSTVETFKHLCVTDAKSPPHHVSTKPPSACRVPRKELVVYNAKPKVYTAPYMPDVKFLPDHQPPSFTVTSSVALIVTSRYLNNMNHFWREFMFPMAHLLWNSGIPRGIKPLLLFSRPPINHCGNGTKMLSGLLRWLDTFTRPILNVEMIEDAFDWRMYHSLPHGTCFPTSILFNPVKYSKKAPSSGLSLKMRRALMHMFNLTVGSCDHNGMVTFISRNGDREIVNEVELQNAVKVMGYNMRVVSMETLSLGEQARQVMCSKVLIGVQGAGLTWAMMLQNDASLIEIAWPKHGWKFRYSTKEMKGLWPRVRTFQITPSRVILPDDHYGLLKRYYGYMVTPERNISTAATQLMETFHLKGKTIVVNVAKLSSFLEKCQNQDGLDSLLKELSYVNKKKTWYKGAELLRTMQRTLSPASFKVLSGLTDAMISITLKNAAKRLQGYISASEFVTLLIKAAR